MKTIKLLQFAFIATLAIFLSISTSQAQWVQDPSGGGLSNTDINTTMYRNGNVSIGGTNPIPSENEEQKEEINALNEKVELLENNLAMVMEVINALQNNAGKTTDLGSTKIESTPKAMLSPNRPNPVNGTTTIDYTIEEENAQLVVYDLTGKILDTYDLAKGQGSIDYNAAGLMNGTYIYAIVANGQTLAQQKMIIQK